MTRQGGNTDEAEIRSLLHKIDELELLPGKSKVAKLNDVTGEIVRLEADLLGLRRLLVQHKNPNALIDDQGTTISAGARSRMQQLERLREYRNDIKNLPDDAAGDEKEDEDE